MTVLLGWRKQAFDPADVQNGLIAIPLVVLASREISYLGSNTGTSAQLRDLVALVRTGKLKLPTVTVRPLAQAERSLQDLEAGRVTGRIVLDTLALAD